MSPYNLSIKRVEVWKAELQKLLSGEPVAWETPSPHKLAYALREALAAARHHGIEPYASIDYVFTQTANSVKATPKDNSALEFTPTTTEATFPEAMNEFDIIAIAGKAKEKVMIFPNFSGELMSVKSWADAKGYALEEDPLTIRRK